jgi:hypothetical protein
LETKSDSKSFRRGDKRRPGTFQDDDFEILRGRDMSQLTHSEIDEMFSQEMDEVTKKYEELHRQLCDEEEREAEERETSERE